MGPAPEAGAGHLLAMWRRPLAIGAPLSSMPLPLTREKAVWVDFEQTCTRAAEEQDVRNPEPFSRLATREKGSCHLFLAGFRPRTSR